MLVTFPLVPQQQLFVTRSTIKQTIIATVLGEIIVILFTDTVAAVGELLFS